MNKAGVLLLLLAATFAACQDPAPGPVCEDFNTGVKYYNNGIGNFWSATGTEGHASGYHIGAVVLAGQCSYLSQSTQWCEIVAESSGDAFAANDDGGNLTNPLYMHAVSAGSSGGAGTSNGPTIQTAVTGAAGASSCLKVLGCNVTITFEAKALGVGTTVNFTNPNIGFDDHFPYLNSCAQEIDPEWRACITGCGGGGGGGGAAVGTPSLWINLKNGKSVVISPKN
jgi:hypothetical protein